MKLVYICSPYAGDVESNIRFARAACRYAVKQGCAPIAVHLLYPQILNDAVPAERESGIGWGCGFWPRVKNFGCAAAESRKGWKGKSPKQNGLASRSDMSVNWKFRKETK